MSNEKKLLQVSWRNKSFTKVKLLNQVKKSQDRTPSLQKRLNQNEKSVRNEKGGSSEDQNNAIKTKLKEFVKRQQMQTQTKLENHKD